MANRTKSIYCTSQQESLYQIVEDVMNTYIPLGLSLCGTISNFINMLIFCKLGLKDSMSINLLALSLADFLTTVLESAVCICYLTNRLYPKNEINVLELGYFGFSWMMNAMYLTSCWITALITVERCFCVVFPFTFKLIFTKQRTIFATATIGILHTLLHVPIYVVHKTECWEIFQEFPINNITKSPLRFFITVFNQQSAILEMVFDILVSVALGNIAFIIIITCTVWMIYALHATAKIRPVALLKQAENNQLSQLSSKERKLSKVALALAITLTSCALPRIVVVAVQSSMSNEVVSPLLGYINMMWAVSYMCTTCGCFVTIFVYLSLNASYRVTFATVFRQMCRCGG